MFTKAFPNLPLYLPITGIADYFANQQSSSFIRILHLPLDGFPFLPIIGRNHTLMYTTLSSLNLIVVVLAVLIIKDQFSVRMATVRAK